MSNTKEIIARHKAAAEKIETWLLNLGFREVLHVNKPQSGGGQQHDHAFTVWQAGTQTVLVQQQVPWPQATHPRPHLAVFTGLDDGNNLETLQELLKDYAGGAPLPADGWHTMETEGEPGRLVVDGDNRLVADCNPPSAEDLGLPEDYRRNARLIARMPRLIAELRNVEDWLEGDLDNSTNGEPEMAETIKARLKSVRAALK